MEKLKITYAFIDAANLFYGGEKSLGWKIDYQKLLYYIKGKYNVSQAFYFGGVEIHSFHYDYLRYDSVPVKELELHLKNFIASEGKKLSEGRLLAIDRHLQRVRFYLKLKNFGYKLFLKPVKLYRQEDGSAKRKANCDVDMAFYLMREQDNFDRALILSGDGDFLPVFKYLKGRHKEVTVLARGPRTAREVKQFCAGDFRDFVRLEKHLRLNGKNK